MLFDLAADPNEERDLAGVPAHARTLDRMRRLLDDWMKETNDPYLHGTVPAPGGSTVTPRDWYGTREKDRAKYRLYANPAASGDRDGTDPVT